MAIAASPPGGLEGPAPQVVGRLQAAQRLLGAAVASAVEPFDFGPPTGLGLRCTRRVPAGDVLLEAPITCAVTAERARAAVLEELGVEAAALPEVTPQDFLCLWLLLERERGAASNHADYIAQLPQNVAEMSAAFWPPDVLAELEGSDAHVRLTDLRDRVEAAHQRVCRAVEAGGAQVQARLAPLLSSDSYIWARSVLNSRQFEGSWAPDTQVTGLLMPPFELFNHSCTLPLGQSLRRSGYGMGDAVQVVALRDFEAGEEALISYGRLGSSQLLERGFVVEGNPDDCVELILGVKSSARRLPLLLRAAEAAASPEEMEDLEWLQLPTSSSSGEVRVVVRRRRPLPAGLLELVRLECLSEEALEAALQQESADDLAPLGQECERVALGRLLAVADAMLSKYPGSVEADAAALASVDDVGTLHRMAIAARLAERMVFCDLARAAHTRLLLLLRDLHGRTLEPVGGSVWFCYLRDAKPHLEQAVQSGSFAQHFRRLQSLPLGGGAPGAAEAVHAAACHKVFSWLHDVLTCPAAQKAPDVDKLTLWAANAQSAEERLYFEKMVLWGQYLMAQFLACGAFGLSDMNTMQMESIGLRNAHAWSVPTSEALTRLESLGPLLEVGCGNGVWAQLLKSRGVDILAFDTLEWDSRYGERDGADSMMGSRNPVVMEGGPETVEVHRDRTLLLMWPDYNGTGTFGTACLSAYRGARLALVGEWRGQTYGLQNVWGQSFSEEFVRRTEADFELELGLPLPCWPLALDSLMIWRRRGLAA